MRRCLMRVLELDILLFFVSGKVGIRTNATPVFSVNLALLVAKAGAGYLSIFVGRLDDTGQVIKNYGFKSEVLAAKYPASASCYAVCPGRVSCGDDSTWSD